MDKKALDRIYKFMVKSNRIKGIKRTGWIISGIREPEHVGDHSYSTGLLSFLLARRLGLNAQRCLLMGLTHDVHESITGDIASRDDKRLQVVSDKRKNMLEHRDTVKIMSYLPSSENKYIMGICRELEEQKTAESRLVKQVDRLDIAFQMIVFWKEMPIARRKEFLSYIDTKVKEPELRYLFDKAVADMKKG